MKRLLASLVIVCIAVASLFQATTAAFQEAVTVAGTSFTVGTDAGSGQEEDSNTALKLLVNVSGAIEASNMADSVNGPSFDNITPEWTGEMLLKAYNKGSSPLDLVSTAEYINDPNTLRDDIYVNVLAWNDLDNDGFLDAGEEGDSYGYDTILRWKNDTFVLGEIEAKETRGFIMRFDGAGLSEANIGQSAVYDFVINGIEQSI